MYQCMVSCIICVNYCGLCYVCTGEIRHASLLDPGVVRVYMFLALTPYVHENICANNILYITYAI